MTTSSSFHHFSSDAEALTLAHGDHTESALEFRDDGSIKVSTALLDSDAPESFIHTVDAPGAAFVEQPDDRWGRYVDGEGEAAVLLTSPEVEDQNGAEVPSSFTVSEGTATLTVDHQGGEYAYPLVATVDAGQDLFGSITYGTHQGQPKVSFPKSAYGAANHYPWNLGMFHNEGWQEIRAKDTRGYVDEKQAMHDQYDCHVSGGYFDWAGSTWDLELVRPNLNQHWSYGVGQHRCNWIDANGNPEGGSS